MTRAALTKLLLLVILAFIVCLPEFFTLYRASKVNFLCLPYRPLERGNKVKRGGDEKIRNTENRREDKCNPSQIQAHEKWKQACEYENQRNATEFQRSDEYPDKSLFMCETDLDMSTLQSNISSSGLKVHFEVSVELQLRRERSLNLTLYSHNNLSSLHLHPYEEEEEEKGDDDEGQLMAFYCCIPLLPNSTNQSRCLLWFSNQTVLELSTKKELQEKRIPKDKWQCLLMALWLALLCIVLLTVVLTVHGQIYRERSICKTLKMQPVSYNINGQHLNDDVRKHAEDILPKGTILHPYSPQPWPGLSPIQEVDVQDDAETLLDGNIDNIYTVNLHHRGHPSTSSFPEEQ